MTLPQIENIQPASSAEQLGGNHLFEIFTIPQEPTYTKSIAKLRQLGLSTVVGNSANTARSKFGEALATSVGARFVHTGLKPKVDELTRTGAEEIHPTGLILLSKLLRT